MIHDNKEPPSELTRSAQTPNRNDETHVAFGSEATGRGPFAWPPRFFKRNELAYSWENKPWSQSMPIEGRPEGKDEMTFLLQIDGDSARFESRVRPVLDICANVNLQDLLGGDQAGPMRPMGWLIDGNYHDESGEWTSRPCLGALSARQLTSQLLKKRYKCSGVVEDDDESNFIDAERRLIYITDLDCWSILALMMTAPESQASWLGEFLQKHLCARPSIGISFASDGPFMFSLDFHLPFRVWRTSEELLRDARVKNSNGMPLRSSRDTSFLMTYEDNDRCSESVHGIYSGHIACMITGYDMWRWTALFAIDTWFDENEDSSDKVTRYQYDLEDSCEIGSDPLSCGKDDSERPIWHPRAYFLRIMLIRLEQVKDEWELIRQNLDNGIVNFGRKQKILFQRIRPFTFGSNSEEYGSEFEEFESCLEELRELLQEISHDLQETLKIGESFLSTEVNYFRNYDGYPGDASDCYPYLSEIRRKFNELAQLCIFFDSLKERCNDMMGSCEAARRKYFFRHRLLRDDNVNEMQNQRDILELRLDTERITEQLRRRRRSDTHQPDSTLPIQEAAPSRADLMSLFLRSPVPYFWALTAILTPSSSLLDYITWRRLLLVVYAIVPLTLVAYAYWLLYATHGRSSTDLTPEAYVSSKGMTERLVRRLHMMLGGLPGPSSAPQNDLDTIELSESLCQGGNMADHADEVTDLIRLLQNGNLDTTAYIPICLPDDEGHLWRLKQLPRKDCVDDRSFFEALKSLVREKSWRTWFGFLSLAGLRKPVGLHYVQFALGFRGQIRILRRESTFPPDSEALIYCPTHSDSCSARPVGSKALLKYYEHPPAFYESGREILNQIVHKIDGPFPETQSRGVGYGLEVEEGPNHYRFALIRFSMGMSSLVFGSLWAWKTGDIENGFAIATLLALTSVMGVTTLETTATNKEAVPSSSAYSAEMV